MTNSAEEEVVFIILEHSGDIYQVPGVDIAAIFFSKLEKTEVRVSKLAGYTTLNAEDKEFLSALIPQIESQIRENWQIVLEMRNWATGLQIRGPYPVAEFDLFNDSVIDQKNNPS